MDQFVIKALLIGAFVIFAFVLLRPSGSARGQALRTIALLLLLVAAVVAIAFPQVLSVLAASVGVGRGTDLVLYGLLVVFVGNSLAAARRRRAHDVQITELARQIALQDPLYPAGRQR
ncbi:MULTISPECIES: DUF2304 domain-containing protein [Microbacterium]|uniref:DUF2304 domain-containing protein n=1 Tax=Microbacterium TaxID=33882 RepID=UPI0021C663D7|nr:MULTISPECIES: DUF2304 domain-containing protein [Microbacterium]WAA67399.1 DUF2304 domain-containing protein [Microbacterium oxydans]